MSIERNKVRQISRNCINKSPTGKKNFRKTSRQRCRIEDVLNQSRTVHGDENDDWSDILSTDSDDWRFPDREETIETGFEIIANYSEDDCYDFRNIAGEKVRMHTRSGGYFIALNWKKQLILLDRYHSEDGDVCCCSSCGGWEGVSSTKGIIRACNFRADRAISWKNMKHYALHNIDPFMTLRQLNQEDLHYRAICCLYSSFLWYANMSHGYVFHGPPWIQQNFDVLIWISVVKIQAAFRGWYFRHRVLYSPHTEIGRKFILAQYYDLIANW